MLITMYVLGVITGIVGLLGFAAIIGSGTGCGDTDCVCEGGTLYDCREKPKL